MIKRALVFFLSKDYYYVFVFVFLSFFFNYYFKQFNYIQPL